METNNTNENKSEIEKKKLIKITPMFIAILSFILLNTLIVINLYNKNYEKKDIFRLHVVANSNSLEDQLVKLKVSEKIENYINNLYSSYNTKEDMISELNNESNKIMEISNNTLNENNFNYDTSIKIGKIAYDEKESITMDMEKGTYDSIQVILGEGKGKNFWTLLFPNKDNIQKLEGYETIMPFISHIYDDENELEEYEFNKNEKKEYKSKILEVIDSIKERF